MNAKKAAEIAKQILDYIYLYIIFSTNRNTTWPPHSQHLILRRTSLDLLAARSLSPKKEMRDEKDRRRAECHPDLKRCNADVPTQNALQCAAAGASSEHSATRRWRKKISQPIYAPDAADAAGSKLRRPLCRCELGFAVNEIDCAGYCCTYIFATP